MTLTVDELAELFRVTPRRVSCWLEEGCPCARDADGEALLDAETVAQWRIERTLSALSPRAAVTPPFPSLVEEIRDATTFADLAALAKELAIGILHRDVTILQAEALHALLLEARFRLERPTDDDFEDDDAPEEGAA